MSLTRMIAVLCLVASLMSVPLIAEGQVPRPWPPQEEVKSWEFRRDESSTLYMTRHYPHGAVERWLTIYPGNDSSPPRSGTCRFPNGVTRDMTRGELRFFWEETGAKQAYKSHRR